MSVNQDAVAVATWSTATYLKTSENTSNTLTTISYEFGWHNGIQEEFYAWMVCSVTYMVAATYLFAALIHFLHEEKFFSLLRDKIVSTLPKKKSRRNGIVSNAFIFIAAFVYIIYMFIDLPLYFGNMGSPYCTHYNRTKIVCTAIILFLVYFVLWYRVHIIFYINPLFHESRSRFAKVISNLAPFVLVILTVANTINFLTTPMYEATPIGCHKVRTIETAVLKWSLLLCTTIFSQLLLLFSLIYPLSMHRKQMLDEGIESKPTFPFIKRAAITAGIVMISDITNAIYAIVTDHEYIYLSNIAYDTNMFINLSALFFSFPDWRQKLLLCFAKDKQQHKNVPSSTDRRSVQGSFYCRKSSVHLNVPVTAVTKLPS